MLRSHGLAFYSGTANWPHMPAGGCGGQEWDKKFGEQALLKLVL